MDQIWSLSESLNVSTGFHVISTATFSVAEVTEESENFPNNSSNADKNTTESNLEKRVSRLEKKYPEELVKLFSSISRLKSRIESIETRITSIQGISVEQARVTKACESIGITGYHFIETPADYYSLTLDNRAKLLGAPSIHHLCKSLIYKNTNWDSSVKGPQNSEYYCIIIQYTQKLNSERLSILVRNLIKSPKEKLSNGSYSFRFATPEESFKLSGFSFNAIAPLGMKKRIPIIIATPLTKLVPPVVYLGGGLVDLKLKVADINKFGDATSAFVLDVSDARSDFNEIDEI